MVMIPQKGNESGPVRRVAFQHISLAVRITIRIGRKYEIRMVVYVNYIIIFHVFALRTLRKAVSCQNFSKIATSNQTTTKALTLLQVIPY